MALMTFAAATISSSIRSFSPTGSTASWRRRSTLRALSCFIRSVMILGSADMEADRRRMRLRESQIQ